jgi:LmbE family N-acetylglucosaminyl deacetylase
MKHTSPELKPKIVLGVGAHPDDLEYGAAGTLAKWAAAGAKVYYLILTDGSKGTTDASLSPASLVATRQAEQQAAAKIVGASDVFFGAFKDGELENTASVRREIVRRIRVLKPEVVVGWDPTFVYSADMVNHPDHRAAGQAMLDAVYPYARDIVSFPELQKEGLEPHKVGTVLLINPAGNTYISDITGHLDTKIQALSAHASQGGVEPAAATTKRAHDSGEPHGLAAAEGFVRIDLPA